MKRLVALIFGLTSTLAMAQDTWPSRAIRIVVPYAPGGASDVLARSIGEQLTQRLKQPVIVENRTGAAGQIGANACRSAPPDGYTYCVLLSDIIVIHPFVYKQLPYDVNREFAPVVSIAVTDVVLVGSAKSAAKDLRDLVAQSRATKTPLTWGTYGTGSSAHLLAERVSRSLDVEITAVPYPGGAPANAAVLAGQVDMSLSGYGIIAQHLAAGSVKPLAVLGKKRLAQLPNTPTLAEQGIDFKAELWQAMFAPKGTPAVAINRMNKEINEIVREPSFVARVMTPGGYSVTGGSPTDLADIVRQDSAEWGALAKALNLKLD